MYVLTRKFVKRSNIANSKETQSKRGCVFVCLFVWRVLSNADYMIKVIYR